jgi:alpha-tubulin suppressor-like RCC1 family protein
MSTLLLAAVLAVAPAPAPSPISAAAPRAVVPAARPSAPTAATATPLHRAVLLTWSEPSSTGGPTITAYRVQRQRPNGRWATLTRSASATARSFTVTGLTNGERSTFRVAAINADGVGPNSPTVSARPRPVPAAPRAVAASARDRAVAVTWKAPAKNGTGRVTGYRIQRQLPSGAWKTAATVGRAKRASVIAGLTNGTTSTVRVIAINRAGAGTPSAARSVVLPTTLQVSAGTEHTCAVMPDRTARCWGANFNGQLGDGTTDASSQPVSVLSAPGIPLTGVARIASGGNHSCAVMTDTTVRCWGLASNGQLGNGADQSDPPALTATTVLAPGSGSEPLTGVQDATAGLLHTCAWSAAGAVWCWGDNTDGQIGIGSVAPRFDRAQVVTIPAVTSLATGDYHTCAALADTTARCWGYNIDGQLGIGTIGPDQTSPLVVKTAPSSDLTGVTRIHAGAGYSCATMTDRTAYCWGDDAFGQMSDGDPEDDSPFAAIVKRTAFTSQGDIVSLGTGDYFACAALVDRNVACWGDDSSGQLGDGTKSSEPTSLPALSLVVGALEVTGGGTHACARIIDGTVRCWGSNGGGQVGDGTDIDRPTPVRPTGL